MLNKATGSSFFGERYCAARLRKKARPEGARVGEVCTKSPPSRAARPYAGAEDENIDRLRRYYFKNTIYEKVVADLHVRLDWEGCKC